MRMSRIEVKEFDIVKLKDGREGTVVHIHDQPELPLAYEIEFGGKLQLETVKAKDVEVVVWREK